MSVPPIQALVFVEGKEHTTVHMWTVPHVGDKISDDYSETYWEVLEVKHHAYKAFVKGDEWDTPPKPESHLTLKVRDIA